jgi:hypothetical protein
VQERGTGTICFRECTGYIKKVGWILMGGTNRHNTRIITAYNPCKNQNVNLGTSYQQQCRYFITRKKDLTCPLVFFRRDLIKQLKEWRAAGDKIIFIYGSQQTHGRRCAEKGSGGQ